MLDAMANAKALVCPLKKDKLNYCVGLSTIADAIGLQKPLIITRNPYHDEIYTKGMEIVNSVDDWVKAIQMINETEKNEYRSQTKLSMHLCWNNMKDYICK